MHDSINPLGATLVILSLSVWLMAFGYAIYLQFVKWSKRRSKCHHGVTSYLSSIQKRKCYHCGDMLPWPLKEGQQPLVSSSRDKRSK